jgi:hypothetical protein
MNVRCDVMELTHERIRHLYSQMTPPEQARFLALLALNLTVVARNWYPTEEGQPAPSEKLIAINELQHTVTGQLVPLLGNDARRYPDDVLINILFEKGRAKDVERHVIAAIRYTYRALGTGPSDTEMRHA